PRRARAPRRRRIPAVTPRSRNRTLGRARRPRRGSLRGGRSRPGTGMAPIRAHPGTAVRPRQAGRHRPDRRSRQPARPGGPRRRTDPRSHVLDRLPGERAVGSRRVRGRDRQRRSLGALSRGGPVTEPDQGNDRVHRPLPVSPIEARVAAIESVLVEKGLFGPDQLDAIVENFEHNLGPMNGARVVARAWVDPDYKSRLLADGTAAIAELGFAGPEGDHMV